MRASRSSRRAGWPLWVMAGRRGYIYLIGFFLSVPRLRVSGLARRVANPQVGRSPIRDDDHVLVVEHVAVAGHFPIGGVQRRPDALPLGGGDEREDLQGVAQEHAEPPFTAAVVDGALHVEVEARQVFELPGDNADVLVALQRP